MRPIQNLSRLSQSRRRRNQKKLCGSALSAESLEIRQVLSASGLLAEFSTPANGALVTDEGLTIPNGFLPLVDSAFRQVLHQIESGSRHLQQPELLETVLNEKTSLLVQELVSKAASDFENGAGQTDGFSVLSLASSDEIQRFLSEGVSASTDLIVLRCTTSADSIGQLTGTGTVSIEANGLTVEAQAATNLSGTTRLSANILFGLDAAGRVFVREGSTVSSEADASGELSLQADLPGNSTIMLSGDGQLTAHLNMTADDGDAVAAERLYLDTDTVFSHFDDHLADFASLDWSAITADLHVSNLNLRANGTGFIDLIQDTGHLTLAEVDWLDSFAEQLSAALDAVSDQVSPVVNELRQLPVFGDELADTLAPMVRDAFGSQLSTGNVSAWPEQRGFHVDSVVSLEDLISGQFTDIFVISYRDSISPIEPMVVDVAGALGGESGISFSVNGSIEVRPQLTVNVTFGLDAHGEIFVVEGSHAAIDLDVQGNLTGTARIPGISEIHARLGGNGDTSIANATAGVTLDDGDRVNGERLYLTGNDIGSGSAISDFTISGGAAFEASLSVNDPKALFPSFIRPVVAAVLPDSVDWTANVSYDVTSGQLNYSVDDSDLGAVITAFQGADGLQDALENYALQRVSDYNPIPENLQQFLGKKIPLLDQNVMDLLNIPESLQRVLAPAAFRGTSSATLSREGLQFDLQLLKAENLIRMLSGQQFDIVDVTFNPGRFQRDIASVTVIPETIVASWLGIFNATVQVDVTPGFFIDVFMNMGLDSESFYIVGEAQEMRDAGSASHFALGGSLKLDVQIEGDVVYVLDLARVTAGFEIEAFGNFTLVSPHHNDSRIRLNELKSMDLAVDLGIDLILSLTGEVGLVKYDRFDLDVTREFTIPVYRKSGGTLSEVEAKLDSFKEELKSKGKRVIFTAAAATGDPHLIAAAAYIIYQETHSYFDVARELILEHGIKVTDTIRYLHQEAHQNVSQIVSQVSKATNDAVKIAEGLYQEVTQNVGEIFVELRSQLHVTFIDAARIMKQQLNVGYSRIAKVLTEDLHANLFEAAEALWHGVDKQVDRLVSTLKDQLHASASQILEVLARLGINSGQGFIDFLEGLPEQLLNTAMKQLGDSQLGKLLKELPSGLIRRLPGAIGSERLGRLLNTPGSTDLNRVLKGLSSQQVADVFSRLGKSTLANLGQRLEADLAASVMNRLSGWDMTDLVSKLNPDQLERITKKLQMESIRRFADNLPLSQQVELAKRLGGDLGKNFMRGLKSSQAIDVLDRVGTSVRITAIREWLSYDVANDVISKLDAEKLKDVASAFSSNTLLRFATAADMGSKAIGRLFNSACKHVAGDALIDFRNHSRLGWAIDGMSPQRLADTLKYTGPKTMNAIFRKLSAKEAGDIVNRLSASVQKEVFRYVDAQSLKDSKKYWNDATKSVQKGVEKAGQSILKFASQKSASLFRW